MLAQRRLFLQVERSATGRAWRDRLDERASAGALSMVQRHGVPELLARIVAGRGVELEKVEAFLDPTVKRLMPDPETLTDMTAAGDKREQRRPVAAHGDPFACGRLLPVDAEGIEPHLRVQRRGGDRHDTAAAGDNRIAEIFS